MLLSSDYGADIPTTLTFDGLYSTGDTECITMNLAAVEDSLVEHIEDFSLNIHPRIAEVVFYIIDNDCKYMTWLQCLALNRYRYSPISLVNLQKKTNKQTALLLLLLLLISQMST